MVSLEMTAEEAREEGYGSPAEAKPPKYPWGTSITLVDEAARGAFPAGIPAVDTECTVIAKVYVKGVNSTEREGGEKCLALDLQFTEIEVHPVAEKPSAAQAIYGESGPRQSED